MISRLFHSRTKAWIIPAIICFLCSTIAVCLYFGLQSRDVPVATINGEKIYQSQIDKVTNQMPDHSIDPQHILEASIDRLLVVQKGKALSIDCTEKEIQDFIADYQKNLGEFYRRGIQIYGEKLFVEGLVYNIIYNKTQEWFFSSQLQQEEVNNSILEEYLKQKNITLAIDESNYETIKNKYQEEQKKQLFRAGFRN